jgi:ABC-type transport system involved in Fe-S cluster assembly fused permease/ATPase subunit
VAVAVARSTILAFPTVLQLDDSHSALETDAKIQTAKLIDQKVEPAVAVARSTILVIPRVLQLDGPHSGADNGCEVPEA